MLPGREPRPGTALKQPVGATLGEIVKTTARMIYFGFIAVLMLSEMLTSNLYSLLGPLKDTAELMGVSVEVERVRLIILILLDALPGIAAVVVLWAYKNTDVAGAGRAGVIATTIGMLAYGAYQFWSATYQLGNMQNFVKLVGVVYAALGVVAWFVGGDLRQGRLPAASPSHPLETSKESPHAG